MTTLTLKTEEEGWDSYIFWHKSTSCTICIEIISKTKQKFNKKINWFLQAPQCTFFNKNNIYIEDIEHWHLDLFKYMVKPWWWFRLTWIYIVYFTGLRPLDKDSTGQPKVLFKPRKNKLDYITFLMKNLYPKFWQMWKQSSHSCNDEHFFYPHNACNYIYWIWPTSKFGKCACLRLFESVKVW